MELTSVDQLWVADITYIRLETGFVYLAVVLDALSRRVICRSRDANPTTGANRLKNEGALTRRFTRHGRVYRSDVSFLLINLGRDPASRSGPGQAIERGRNTLCPIVRDEFRPAFP